MERTRGPKKKKFYIETASREELVEKIENQGKTLTSLHKAQERDAQNRIDDFSELHELQLGLRKLIKTYKVPAMPVLKLDPRPSTMRDHMC